jgi:hypothetical protein
VHKKLSFGKERYRGVLDNRVVTATQLQNIIKLDVEMAWHGTQLDE